MSVVVRMEMPKNNCEMAVEIKGTGDWCPVEARVCGYYSTKKMPPWCPIICQLPDGHGDLIDRDSMVEEWVDEKIGNPHADYEADDVIYDLKKRIVIVPKDKAHEP